MVFFTWVGFDEIDEDDSIEITFTYHYGDEAIFKAKRHTSSTACETPDMQMRSYPRNRPSRYCRATSHVAAQ